MRENVKDTTFIRGEVGVCHRCAQPIDVEKHVVSITVFPTAATYMVAHPCGFRVNMAVPRSVHRSTVEYLAQVAEGRRETGTPVSPEEELLAEFAAQMETIQNIDDIQSAFDRRGEEDI